MLKDQQYWQMLKLRKRIRVGKWKTLIKSCKLFGITCITISSSSSTRGGGDIDIVGGSGGWLQLEGCQMIAYNMWYWNLYVQKKKYFNVNLRKIQKKYIFAAFKPDTKYLPFIFAHIFLHNKIISLRWVGYYHSIRNNIVRIK